MGIDHNFGKCPSPRARPRHTASLPTEGRSSFRWPTVTNASLVLSGQTGWPSLGFRVVATEGTAEMLRRNGIPCSVVRKHFPGAGGGTPADDERWTRSRPARSTMVINTPYGNSGPRIDGYEIRSAAVGDEHPLHHDSAGCLGGGAGYRGRNPW